MPKVRETVFTYLARIGEVQDQMKGPIVVSTRVNIPTLKDGDVEKLPIAWPLFDGYNMFYVVKVPAKKHVHAHSHDEDVFRFIVKGSLVINGNIEVKEGMWFVVRANTAYEIETETGYTTFAGYGHVCLTSDPEGMHEVVPPSAPLKK
jgi:hypothetical protein